MGGLAVRLRLSGARIFIQYYYAAIDRLARYVSQWRHGCGNAGRST